MWLFIFLVVIVVFIWNMITAPMRSAKSLKRIERDLRKRP